MKSYTSYQLISEGVILDYTSDAGSIETLRHVVGQAIALKAEFSLRAYRGDDTYSVAACGWTRENGQYVSARDAWLLESETRATQ